MQAMIRSIQVGRPRSYGGEEGGDKRWRSAIQKRPVEGPIFVSLTNLAGDRQADLTHHGGTDKAVLAYSADHFAAWRAEFPDWPLTAGAFGENLTLEGLREGDVCIGDVFEIGACRVQVSQPRQPCWKLSRRWNLPKLETHVKATGRTGWYLRVLCEGWIEAGMDMTLIERPYPDVTVAWANSVMYAKPRVADNDRALAACPALADVWRGRLVRR